MVAAAVAKSESSDAGEESARGWSCTAAAVGSVDKAGELVADSEDKREQAAAVEACCSEWVAAGACEPAKVVEVCCSEQVATGACGPATVVGVCYSERVAAGACEPVTAVEACCSERVAAGACEPAAEAETEGALDGGVVSLGGNDLGSAAACESEAQGSPVMVVASVGRRAAYEPAAMGKGSSRVDVLRELEA
ncbi:DUF4573 domain-containing protein [Canna indica]|uniref:DUF4573 domain-containing protein n=1 Tax=Canna indica TaxID=4628 RepID=A0AAQ3KXU3_9LILI|nr:DUF4573 domain-containing protein [Canna indica]